jgi:hypothetical protein
MTCFWDGILKELTNDDFKKLKTKKPNNKNFVVLLKNSNTKETKNIKWNGDTLSDNQIKENYEHIKDFDVKSIRNGYLCSTCDPFLILVCKLFNVNIYHKYCGNLMKYEVDNPNRTLHFKSNKGHFSS